MLWTLQEVGNGTVQERACDPGPGLRPAFASLFPTRGGCYRPEPQLDLAERKQEHPEATAKGNDRSVSRQEFLSSTLPSAPLAPASQGAGFGGVRLWHGEVAQEDRGQK